MRKRYIALLGILLLTANISYGQKKAKVPPYEPVTGVAQEDVAALIYLSLDELNNDKSSLLSKEEILLEQADITSQTYQTNYIHYVAMMMHRRLKANYSFSDGSVHVDISDISVQNQTNGGKWEESKMAVKGDKKIRSKLAMKIKELNTDKAKLAEARMMFYGDLDNIYVMMAGGEDNSYSAQKTALKNSVSGFGKGLNVVDADLNETGNDLGKYMVKYSYTAPASIQNQGSGSLTFIQYTNSETATGLSKGEAISSIADCSVEDINADGEIVFSSGNIAKKSSGYDFKKLVDTDPIAGISFDDAFPVIYSVLEKEQIETSKVNMGDQFMTTSWVKIKDGKIGQELDGILTFNFDEGKIWPYYLQIIGENGKNSQCLSKACKELKVDLSNKIIEAHKNGDLDGMKKAFYSDPKVNEIVQNGKFSTTLSKKMWDNLIGSVK